MPRNQKAKRAATATAVGEGKKKRRFKPGTVALREIKRYQKSVENVLPRRPF